MLISPEANLYTAIIERITAEVPEIRYIDLDLGQLENYEIRPAVAWPCMLIDLDESKYSDAGSKLHQLADCMITIRLGVVKYTDSNNLTPTNIRPNALKYFELENKVFKALHGWAAPGFNRLLRVGGGTEKRDDDIRVRVSRYSYTFTDTTAEPVRQSVPRPDPSINNV